MARSRIYLSDEICANARDKMHQLLEAQDEKGIMIQHRAADSLLRACQTQERYQLKPQTPADFARATTHPFSEAERLDNLTAEEIDALHATLTADYPKGREH